MFDGLLERACHTYAAARGPVEVGRGGGVGSPWINQMLVSVCVPTC